MLLAICHKPSAICHKPFAISHLLLAIRHKPSAICHLLLAICYLLSGCASEYNLATRQEEWFYYSTEREVRIGENIAREIEKKYKFVDDQLITKRVEDIGRMIVEVCDRRDIKYHFYVLDEEEVNAMALPGGFIYVFKGLIEKVANDDELAAVLAHEVGHVVARHSIKKLQAIMGYTFLRILLAQAPSAGELGQGADAAFVQIMSGYSREDELLADQLAARYARLAGFDSYAMITFLEKLRELDKYKVRPLPYARTHPYIPDRIRVVKQELGESLSFEDYINIEQQQRR